jgi:hypothetical protein
MLRGSPLFWVGLTYSCLALAIPSNVQAQNLTVERWIDLFVSLCVGSGSTTTVSGTIRSDQNNGSLTLNDIGPDNQVAGAVTISKKDFRLLSDGIDSKISTLQASEADKVRDCLAPVRQQVLYAMVNPIRGEMSILSPYENELIKVLSQETGMFGAIGKDVPYEKLRQVTGYSEIRTRVTLRYLKLKGMVVNVADVGPSLPDNTSLTEKGDEYSLIMGYTQ